MADLGWPELTIIALAVVLLFGWKRMPDMARSLGRSARIFKSEVDQMRTDADASTLADTLGRSEARWPPRMPTWPPPTPRSRDCAPSSMPGGTRAGRTS